jgi:hypothetical protein
MFTAGDILLFIVLFIFVIIGIILVVYDSINDVNDKAIKIAGSSFLMFFGIAASAIYYRHIKERDSDKIDEELNTILEDISKNDISKNDISKNDISKNDISKNDNVKNNKLVVEDLE